MPAVVAPDTGLEMHELGHPWGYGTPTWPGHPDIRLERVTSHAKQGVLAQRLLTTMHTATHLNAPLHLIPRGAAVGDLPIERCFGNGAVLDVPKEPWAVVTARDLQAARPNVRAGDLVIVNTGWHRHYSDSQEYFGRAPGLGADAAQWLVDRGAALVGVDTAAIDHPLATSLAMHRNGPQMKYLPARYRAQSGRDPAQDFPDWNPAHRILLGAGIPTVENVGGDVDEVSGRRVTLHAVPWEWHDGDACVIRLVAMLDPSGQYRIGPGTAEDRR